MKGPKFVGQTIVTFLVQTIMIEGYHRDFKLCRNIDRNEGKKKEGISLNLFILPRL